MMLATKVLELGPGQMVEATHELSEDLSARAEVLLLDRRLRRLLVGLDDGHIAEWKLADVDERPQFVGVFQAAETSITA